MSLENIGEMIGAELTPENIEALITASFPTMFGRYESTSGKMAVEMCHASEGKVRWKRFEHDLVVEEALYDYKTVIPKFKDIVEKGFQPVFKALTEEDISREHAKRRKKLSKLARLNLLGTYRKGEDFVRVNEWGHENYFVEFGYRGTVTENRKDLTADKTLAILDEIDADGFV